MKFTHSVYLTCFVLLCFFSVFSCSKKETEKSFENQDESFEKDSEEMEIGKIISESVVSEKLLSSVVLSPSVNLNILGRDYKMHRMKNLLQGNVFEAVSSDDEIQILNLYPENKNSEEESQSEKSEKYIHAVYDSVDFWIYADYVAVDSYPAIVVTQTGNLKFAQIVAVANSPQEDENLVQVYYFNKELDKVCSIMMDSSAVSSFSDDVEMASIIQKLKTTTRAVPRNELFLKAEKLHPSPAMKKMLDAEKTEKLSYDYQEVLKTMPGARYIVNVEELNTVDQTKDPFKN